MMRVLDLAAPCVERSADLRPLAVDLFTGLHGWAEGFIAEGWRVVGYDIEDMSAQFNEPKPDHFELVLQDVRTLHGSQIADADCIVASPPCQAYSYMAMPFGRGRQAARALRRADVFPDRYKGPRTIADLTELFDACFRIQREACEAAGRHIPMVVENVRGAEPWVGRARWSFGSYYLWGDVPALMPPLLRARKNTGGSWFNIAHNTTSGVGNNPDGRKNPGFRFDGSGRSFQSESVERHVEGQKAPGSTRWFNDGPRTPDSLASASSSSPRRKAASAKIAKIPLVLAAHIARTYYPQDARALQQAAPRAGDRLAPTNTRDGE